MFGDRFPSSVYGIRYFVFRVLRCRYFGALCSVFCVLGVNPAFSVLVVFALVNFGVRLRYLVPGIRCPAFVFFCFSLLCSAFAFGVRLSVFRVRPSLSVIDFGIRPRCSVFGIRNRYSAFGSATAGCREGDGPLSHARRVDHRSPVVSPAALQVSGFPPRDQGGETPAHHHLAGLPGDASGFGERRFFFNGGAGVDRVDRVL